ncbi:MAG: DUF1553 domain-containing protein [Rubripirellula sp.]|nr:DUF1553 domain-containing protein [Rubripirellula sp.]
MSPLIKSLIRLVYIFASGTTLVSASDVDFNRDVRPILSDKCFHCHGPDVENQDSEFRLDSAEHALADLGGYAAIVANEPEQSELVLRIESDDPDKVMPPPHAPRHLSQKEKSILQNWITQGANYDQHWAFKLPVKSKAPAGTNAIDHFVGKRLDDTGLSPSTRAEKRQLIRRVTLDLTGLPPTPAEVQAFVSDASVTAYENVVDRLLRSPAYGERMAQVWLDASRYADSAGYQNDFKRSQWPWRDWVIDAYNRNMPYDQFSIEQLAGDLLPDATDSTRLATAFSRNHRINNEGGIIPAEFLVEYVADRVETTSTIWLGLTTGCARCHDHKYDPITMDDFYRFFAFFHNVPENGKDGAIAPAPNMNVYTGGTKDQHQKLAEDVARLQQDEKEYAKKHQATFAAWISKQQKRLGGETSVNSFVAHIPFDFPKSKVLSNLESRAMPGRIQGRENHVKIDPAGKFGQAVAFRDAGHVRLGKLFGTEGYDPKTPASWSFFIKPQKGAIGAVLSSQTTDARKTGYLLSLVKASGKGQLAIAFQLVADEQNGKRLEVQTPGLITENASEFTHVAVTYDGSLSADGIAIYINGERTNIVTAADDLPSESFRLQQDHLIGSGLSFAVIDELYIHSICLAAEQVQSLSQHDSASQLLMRSKLSNTQKVFLEKTYFASYDPGYQNIVQQLKRQQKQLAAFEKSKITKVSIMQEMPEARDTHRLIRGDYSQPDTSETLSPATIASLPAMASDHPKNRLGLARWLFQSDNPLTARVAVNRHWQMLFGSGLVKTPEDFGTQGSMPSHPELLDWLAVEFRESGWDIKALLKLIVTSETYCQDSRTTKEMLERDPTNALLSRGARFRLTAFAIRDQALAASGLLVDKQGGPPVMPYQPAGLWEEVSAKGFKYAVAKDEGLYRRSLYTFWRRTVPPPNMINFDSAGRESCTVNVSRTNTPLQALNLQNDPQYVEAALILGERMMKEAKGTPEDRIAHCSELLLGRRPSSSEMKVFRMGYDDYMASFVESPESAKAFVSVGNSVPDPKLDPVELATCSVVATIFLNLDETVTKE